MSKVRRVSFVGADRPTPRIGDTKARSLKFSTDLAFMLLMAVIALASLALARQVQPSGPAAVSIASPASSSSLPTASSTRQLNQVEQALATQEAIGYPGPIPTNPPPPGAPTPDPLYQLRVNFRWTPYSADVRYVTQSGNTLTIAFGVTDSFYTGVSAWSTQASVKVILGIIAHSHVEYQSVRLYGIRGYNYLDRETPAVTLVYTRRVIESRDWLAQPIGDAENIYKLADSSQIEDDLVPGPLPTQPYRGDEDATP